MTSPSDSIDPGPDIGLFADPVDVRSRLDGSQPVGFDGADSVRLPDDVVHRLLDQTDGRISTEQARELAAHLADLERWLQSLPVIEQAKGILMCYYGIDAGSAFNVLRRWSSHHNIKVRTISQRLTAAASHQDSGCDGIRSAETDVKDLIVLFNGGRTGICELRR